MRAETDRNARLAADAAVTAGWLDSGRVVAVISGTSLLTTLVVWLLGHPVRALALAGVGATAVAQLYFALRVRFDARIFRLWASRWHDAADVAADLAAFDARVGRQARPVASLEADLAERRRGALRLLKWQAVSGALQLALTVLALWT
ncbi:hypothetical protein [Denitromonas iodatirespirans]|uniref:Uncharacterized protein n=1 Tax=Denitromonas iodatirespirans TaxID=2795389 RepID=A0A944HA37_DENI1|nr:hypothetical protein [Denitromonas iodatirespirans]MBT0963879.1 hypothetical protein [Denitromonas iodatirespirans]